MHYKLEYTAAARKQLKKLPREILPRIIHGIEQLSENPRPEGIKKLSGYKDYYRLRVGDYRIVYSIRDVILMILIIKIAPRKNVYQKL
jgi:mRNA interferase RelE/StbE